MKELLGIALYTSVILGIEILLMDNWLWSAAPAHAYGLVIFVIVDVALLTIMSMDPRIATIGAAAIGLVQFGAMLSDAAFGAPAGIASGSFKNYLFADTIFNSLLVTQMAIIILAAASLAVSRFHNYRLATFGLRKS